MARNHILLSKLYTVTQENHASPPPTRVFFSFYRKHTSLQNLPFPSPSHPSTLATTVQTYYLWILMTFVNELQDLPE